MKRSAASSSGDGFEEGSSTARHLNLFAEVEAEERDAGVGDSNCLTC